MENTTNIYDLPVNNGMNGGPNAPQMQEPNIQNTLTRKSVMNENYKPLNIHPNPYGISEQNPIQHPSQSQTAPQQPSIESNEIHIPDNYREMVMAQSMNHDLPSRDIPIDNSRYTQDPNVQATHIPNANIQEDFINDYERELERQKTYEHQEHRKKMVDIILEEIQMALFISLLFFVFQTSAFRKLFWNHLTFLPILNADGNLNVYGLVFKSLLFGTFFYITQKTTNYLVEL